MTEIEFYSFKLRTLAKTNGRNIHNIPPLLGYIKSAVLSLANGNDIDFSSKCWTHFIK